MKNAFLNRWKSKVKICVKGKNMERFIKRLATNHIELYEIETINFHEINIVILKSDYAKVEEMKTIYELSMKEVYGFDWLKQLLHKNKYMIITFLIGVILLYLLTHTIFEIEVIHTNKDLRNLLQEELKQHGMDKWKPIKSYEQIQKIKEQILKKYKDKIEWLEIESVGTKYIVRVEERLLNEEQPTYPIQDIVAKKSAILLRIEAESGEIVKNRNDYVKTGDTVISGNIKLNEEIKQQTSAQGKIYGEVWYKATVEYPFTYYEEKETGKKRTVYTYQFLNKRIELFNLKPFQSKKIESKTIWKSNLFPFSLVKEKQKEINIIDEQYTKKEAILKATELATQKIAEQLSEKEEIIRVQQLKVDTNERTIVVELFFAVLEDITATRPIDPITQEQ